MDLKINIFKPFKEQMRWSNPDTDVGSFQKYINNLEEAVKDDPYRAYMTDLGNLNPAQEVVNLPFLLFAGALTFVHGLSRGIFGFLGAAAEMAERATEALVIPKEKHKVLWAITSIPKLFFYLLKQPFKWAETAISSIAHLVSAVMLLVFAVLNIIPGIFSKTIRESVVDMLEYAFKRGGQALTRLGLVAGIAGITYLIVISLGGVGFIAGLLGVSLKTAGGIAATGSVIAAGATVGGSIAQGAVGIIQETCCSDDGYDLDHSESQASSNNSQADLEEDSTDYDGPRKQDRSPSNGSLSQIRSSSLLQGDDPNTMTVRRPRQGGNPSIMTVGRGNKGGIDQNKNYGTSTYFSRKSGATKPPPNTDGAGTRTRSRSRG